MKTKELLDKYQKIIGGLIDQKPEDIRFQILREIKNEEGIRIRSEWIGIGQIFYEKPDYSIPCNFSKGNYRVVIGTCTIGEWKLYELPHCCAYLVSCNATVESKYRNKRVGTALNSMRQDIGRILGYSSILCTDIARNKYQRQLLATNGWKDLHEIKNKRTGNTVFLSVINI